MIRGIHHVAMHARDLDAMRLFYKDAFGFEQVGEEASWTANAFGDALMGVTNGAGRTVMLKAPNCFLEMFEWVSPAPREGGPAQPNDLGYTHFSVEVTDIDAEYERLKGLGMTFSIDRPADLGDIKSVYGRDPEGNVIELQEVVSREAYAFESLGIA